MGYCLKDPEQIMDLSFLRVCYLLMHGKKGRNSKIDSKFQYFLIFSKNGSQITPKCFNVPRT